MRREDDPDISPLAMQLMQRIAAREQIVVTGDMLYNQLNAYERECIKRALEKAEYVEWRLDDVPGVRKLTPS